MAKALSKKQRKIIIFSAAGVLIAALAVIAIVICSYIFRDKEVKINNSTLANAIETAPDALGKTYDNILLPESVSRYTHSLRKITYLWKMQKSWLWSFQTRRTHLL